MRPKFAIGDKVIFTNDTGVCFGERTITDKKLVSYSNSGWGYLITPTDTPWFAVKEENLRAVKEAVCSPSDMGDGDDSSMLLTPHGCERSCHGTGTVELREAVLTVSQERRLNVATQIFAGYLSNGYAATVKEAYHFADLMIAEAAKK